jgi:hypothetical protein
LRDVPGLYKLVLAHLCAVWDMDTLKLCADVTVDIPRNGVRFMHLFSHIWLKKQRYGAATTTRGHSAKYAYIDACVPVEIQYIFRAALEHPTPGESRCRAEFAVIQRFQRDGSLPDFPWALWCAHFITIKYHTKCIMKGYRSWR